MTKISFVAFLLTVVVAASVAPNVNAQTSEEKARAKVVDYMRAATSIKWTPSEDIPYWNKSQGFSFKKGVTYYGIPYTQANRDYDLEKFKTLLKDVNGQATYVGPNGSQSYAGNDCSSCVSHAWRTIDASFPTLSTDGMFPKRQKRIVAVGAYEFNDEKTTIDIVKNNGKAVIKEAYKALKPGDAVLYRGKAGHVMMVTRNDPEHNRLYIADQTGCDNGVPKGRDGQSTMRFDYEWTYDRLFENNYIPIGLKAIYDLGK